MTTEKELIEEIIFELNKGCGSSLSVNMFNFKTCKNGSLCYSCKRAIKIIEETK